MEHTARNEAMIKKFREGATTRQLAEQYRFSSAQGVRDALRDNYPKEYRDIMRARKQRYRRAGKKNMFMVGEFVWFPQWMVCAGRRVHRMRRLTPEEAGGLTSIFKCTRCGFKSALRVRGETARNKLKGRWFDVEKTAWTHRTKK